MVFRRPRYGSETVSSVVRALEIPSIHQVGPRLSSEMRRARRYERPLSVIFVSPEGTELGGEGQGATSLIRFPRGMPTSLLGFVFLGSFLRKSMRESDVLACATEGMSFMVALPEAGESDARGAIRRLGEGFAAYASLRLRAGLAVFPRDGVTMDALLDHAHRAWQTGLLENAARMAGEVPAEVREVSRA